MQDWLEKIGGTALRRALFGGLIILAVGFMLSFFYAYEPPRITRLSNEIQNAGHVPFFGLLTLLFLALSRIFLSGSAFSPLVHYAAALGGSTALGILLELLQIQTSRSADAMDLARNFAGSAIFLAFWYTFDKDARSESFLPSFWTAGKIRAVCIALAAASFIPLLLRWRAVQARNQAFPVICDFDARWSMAFIEKNGSAVRRIHPPLDWTQAQGKKVLKVRTLSSHYPRFKVEEPYPDWTGYSFLAFDLFSTMAAPFAIEIKIQDYLHENHYGDRYNKEFLIQPGINEIRIPLEAVRNAPVDRQMDLRDVQSVTLFSDHPQTKLTFFVGSLRLEKFP